jgi:hypothetical protein
LSDIFFLHARLFRLIVKFSSHVYTSLPWRDKRNKITQSFGISYMRRLLDQVRDFGNLLSRLQNEPLLSRSI